MPLIEGKSPKAFDSNVSREMDSGKPQKQALAIAFAIKKKNMMKKAMGGMIPEQGLNEGRAMIADHFAEGGMAHHIAKAIMGKMGYAKGGEVIADDSDQDLYVEPMDGAQDHEDFLSDADQMPSEEGTPEEHKEDGMGARKVMLSNIMKKLR